MPPSHTVYTTCTRDCPSSCGLLATVQEGRVTKLRGAPNHPLTRGKACIKAARYVQRHYSPERILHPLLRGSRKSGQWQRIGWEQALDLMAEQLRRVRDTYGHEAILYYQGSGERTALKLLNSYFFNLFGGVTTLRGTLCGGTGQAAQNLDLGERISHDPLDHLNSEALILWGRNPVSTQISLVPILQELRQRGKPVLLIDPCHTRSAALADRHIAPQPGGDVFLALAAAKLVLDRGAEDREFLARYSQGGDAYLRLLAELHVPDLCTRAGVAESDAAYLAELLSTRRPTATLLGWGLHRHRLAHHGVRAIDALAALCGNIGQAGGGVSQGFEEFGPYDQQYWGAHLAPQRRTLLLPRLGEELLAADPPIRMIVTTAANPVCMAADSRRVAQAFAQAEFVVYNGHFLDDTADHAHLFLPATTFLEEDDVMAAYGHNYVGPVNRAVEPLGECRSNFAIFRDLARRFPFAEQFQRSEAEWLADLCAPIRAQGCSLESLRQGPFRLQAPMVPYADRVFPTPSGRFEFMTELGPEVCHAPDPAYPYWLMSIAPHQFLCSERTLSEHPPLPVVRLHPEEAARLGLVDGAPVLVESPVGRIEALLHTDAAQRRDCLVTERGGWIKAGHGLNRLIAGGVSALGNGTPFYDARVRVLPTDAAARG